MHDNRGSINSFTSFQRACKLRCSLPFDPARYGGEQCERAKQNFLENPSISTRPGDYWRSRRTGGRPARRLGCGDASETHAWLRSSEFLPIIKGSRFRCPLPVPPGANYLRQAECVICVGFVDLKAERSFGVPGIHADNG